MIYQNLKSLQKKEKKICCQKSVKNTTKKKALEPNKKPENKNEINKFYTPEGSSK